MAQPLDWSVVKERWEAGEESRSIAISCRRKVADIEAMATLEGWSSKRRPTLARTTGQGKARQAAIVLRESVPTPIDRVELECDPAELAEKLDAQTANANHLHDHEKLRTAGLALLDVAVTAKDARLLTAVANALKTSQDGQRKALGIKDAPPDPGQGSGDPDEESGVVFMPAKAPLPTSE